MTLKRKRHETRLQHHSRSPYRHRKPDFPLYAQVCPSFAEKCVEDRQKRLVPRWEDPATRAELAKACFKADFNLEVNVPHEHLAPTVFPLVLLN